MLSRAAQRPQRRRSRLRSPHAVRVLLGLSARSAVPGLGWAASAPRVTLGCVDVTVADIAHVPAENLHVSRADFAALWAAADQVHDERVRRGSPDWYGAGVVVTCRWLARAIVRPPSGRRRPARSPVTERTNMAYPELIETECLAAERLDMRRPVPAWLADQPGWSAAIVATLNWAWRRTGGPPIDITHSATG